MCSHWIWNKGARWVGVCTIMSSSLELKLDTKWFFPLLKLVMETWRRSEARWWASLGKITSINCLDAIKFPFVKYQKISQNKRRAMIISFYTASRMNPRKLHTDIRPQPPRGFEPRALTPASLMGPMTPKSQCLHTVWTEMRNSNLQGGQRSCCAMGNNKLVQWERCCWDKYNVIIDVHFNVIAPWIIK